MKSVCYQGHGTVGLSEVARPVLQQPDDVVLRVEAAAICGSDVHLIQGHMGALPVGTVLGHEFVGVVEEAGPAVSRFAVGDRAVAACTTACGHCWYCRRGFHCQCPGRSAFGHGPLIGQEIPGGQAEYVRVPVAHTNLHPVPDAVSDEQAIFVGDILATAYIAVQNADLRPGDTVAVIGCGPVGLLVAECARLFGAVAVIVIDTVDQRLKQAQHDGALTINSSRKDPIAEARNLTEGRGPDAVVDAAGGSATLRLALELVRPRGVVSVVGVPGDVEYAFPAGPIMAKEVAVRFGLGDPGLGPRLMTLIAAKRLDPARVISHRLPLSEAVYGYEIFQAREATKVLLVP